MFRICEEHIHTERKKNKDKYIELLKKKTFYVGKFYLYTRIINTRMTQWDLADPRFSFCPFLEWHTGVSQVSQFTASANPLLLFSGSTAVRHQLRYPLEMLRSFKYVTTTCYLNHIFTSCFFLNPFPYF